MIRKTITFRRENKDNLKRKILRGSMLHEERFSNVAKTRMGAPLRRMQLLASSGLRFAFSVPILCFDPCFTSDFMFLVHFLKPAP